MIEGQPTTNDTAPQHAPRPLPLFLAMLRSETAASPERQAAAMAGLAAYQAAVREAPPPALDERARVGRASLRGAGGSGRPVVLVPSLINPPAILDIDAERSLVRRLAAAGCDAMLVDWGEPDVGDRDQDIDAHVADLLVPLLRRLAEPPVLVGYCLGGTMAVAAAALTPVAGVATLAAPWRFAGYGEARGPIAAMWRDAGPTCAALGLVPMEVLQAGFWRLDPARTIGKYEAFSRMAPDSAAARAFVRLEDWANAGAPLTYAAGRQLFEDFIDADRPGQGQWSIGGVAIDPARLDVPAIEFVSRTDRIVPAATAAGVGERRDLALGHVGMIVGGRAREALWQPLEEWIARLPSSHAGKDLLGRRDPLDAAQHRRPLT
ncbi:polyhydroxyalkanoate synthase [Sphingomonas jinjuensis]|uniref:Polyhydroxyalkanoate synthase n=1 Tax=Sphingomonas jinjuensis TaxID=535907 RepID=A0A840FDF7_9SPHN|nr:alpha/beta hydrolase [Sphingomonas jinjuensis]MBB4153784.1 polyhydroxyalkanoate synthase [Sphingomonas jinjuensis]